MVVGPSRAVAEKLAVGEKADIAWVLRHLKPIPTAMDGVKWPDDIDTLKAAYAALEDFDNVLTALKSMKLGHRHAVAAALHLWHKAKRSLEDTKHEIRLGLKASERAKEPAARRCRVRHQCPYRAPAGDRRRVPGPCQGATQPGGSARRRHDRRRHARAVRRGPPGRSRRHRRAGEGSVRGGPRHDRAALPWARRRRSSTPSRPSSRWRTSWPPCSATPLPPATRAHQTTIRRFRYRPRARRRRSRPGARRRHLRLRRRSERSVPVSRSAGRAPLIAGSPAPTNAPQTLSTAPRTPTSQRADAGAWRATATSAATRSPERTAPSMYPFHTSAVSAPAKWMRPTASRIAVPYCVQAFGVRRPP